MAERLRELGAVPAEDHLREGNIEDERATYPDFVRAKEQLTQMCNVSTKEAHVLL